MALELQDLSSARIGAFALMPKSEAGHAQVQIVHDQQYSHRAVKEDPLLVITGKPTSGLGKSRLHWENVGMVSYEGQCKEYQGYAPADEAVDYEQQIVAYLTL